MDLDELYAKAARRKAFEQGSLQQQQEIQKQSAKEESKEQQAKEIVLGPQDLENFRTQEAPNGYKVVTWTQLSEYGSVRAQETGGVASTREAGYSLESADFKEDKSLGYYSPTHKPGYLKVRFIPDGTAKQGWLNLYRSRKDGSRKFRVKEDSKYVHLL